MLRFQYSPTTSINYEVHGSGRPVVFLHGFGASLETWRDVQDRLADRFTVFLLDLKGFGRSDKSIDALYTVSEHARIVRDFIVRNELTEAAIVGHSYGGAVAMVAYLLLRDENPAHRPPSLVLIDSAANDRPLPLFVRALRVPLLNSVLLNIVPARMRAAVTLLGLFHNRRLVTRARVDRCAQFFDMPGAHHSFVTCARQVTSGEAATFRSRLGEIEARTLIIWGRDDSALPLADAEYLHAGIRGSRLEIIENCGHIPQEEQPARCADLILEFVGDRAAAASR